MKKTLASAIILALVAGCSTFKVGDETTTTTTTTTNGVPVTVEVKHEVDVWRGNVLMNASVEQANIKYGNVTVDVGNFKQAGDVDSINAIGSAISNGIMAYFTYGSSAAVKGAVMATLKSSATNCVDGACAPVMK